LGKEECYERSFAAHFGLCQHHVVPQGTLTETWVPHDVRDQVVDFVRRWSEKAEVSVERFISRGWAWRQRYGRVDEHNGWVPRDFWLEPWEKEAIIAFL